MSNLNLYMVIIPTVLVFFISCDGHINQSKNNSDILLVRDSFHDKKASYDPETKVFKLEELPEELLKRGLNQDFRDLLSRDNGPFNTIKRYQEIVKLNPDDLDDDILDALEDLINEFNDTFNKDYHLKYETDTLDYSTDHIGIDIKKHVDSYNNFLDQTILKLRTKSDVFAEVETEFKKLIESLDGSKIDFSNLEKKLLTIDTRGFIKSIPDPRSPLTSLVDQKPKNAKIKVSKIDKFLHSNFCFKSSDKKMKKVCFLLAGGASLLGGLGIYHYSDKLGIFKEKSMIEEDMLGLDNL